MSTKDMGKERPSPSAAPYAQRVPASGLAAGGEANPGAAAHDWFAATSGYGFSLIVARIARETDQRVYYGPTTPANSYRRASQAYVEKRHLIARDIDARTAAAIRAAYARFRDEERAARHALNEAIAASRARRDAAVQSAIARRDEATGTPPAASASGAGRADAREEQ